jgi:hypothetical protein
MLFFKLRQLCLQKAQTVPRRDRIGYILAQTQFRFDPLYLERISLIQKLCAFIGCRGQPADDSPKAIGSCGVGYVLKQPGIKNEWIGASEEVLI